MKRLAFIIPFFVAAIAGCDDDPPTTPPAAPMAAFTVAGTQQAGQAVRFDASGSTDPGGGGLSYSWSFGDGAHGGTGQIAHLYAQAGAYAVQLTVRDQAGAIASATQTITIAAGPAATGTATVKGRVTLPDGTPLAGVAVSVAGSTAGAQTDAQGAVTLAGVPAGVPLVLRLDRAGHAEGSVRLAALANGSADGWFQAALAPRGATGTLASAQAGGTVAGPSGAHIVFPPAALVRADGSPATGAVDVAITPVDVVNAIDAFPGPFTGIQADGTSTPIATFGVMEIDVSQGGQPLQLAPGRTATLEIPIYTGGAAAGQTIPLWSLDEVAGMWVQEGSGTVVASAASPTGLALRATVSHLSWWNVDVPYGAAFIKVLCLVQAAPAPTPLAGYCRIRAQQQGGGAPVVAGQVLVPPNVRTTLPIFPGVPTRIYGASAANLAVSGDVLVNYAAGSSHDVDVVLTAGPPPPPAEMIAVGGDGGHPIAAYDGMLWLTKASPFSDASAYGRAYVAAWNGSMWLAGGRSIGGVGLAASLDGSAWNPVAVGPVPSTVYGVAWSGSKWVAVGESGTGPLFASSVDGAAWTPAASVPAGVTGGRFVAWNGTYWLAGTPTGLLRSMDGSVWTAVPAPFGAGSQPRAAAWNGSTWVVVGLSGNGSRVASSQDGTTWVSQGIGIAEIRAVAWNGTSWLVAGLNATATSTNGTTWAVHSPTGIYAYGLAWTGSRWVAAGTALGIGMVATSPDGITWSGGPSPFATTALGVSYRRPLYPPLP